MNSLARVATLGAIAGMRSMSAPAFLANHIRREGGDTQAVSLLRLAGTPGVARLVSLAAVGELVFDKLPIVPSRMDLGPFAGRVAVGAVCGALYHRAHDESVTSGAVVGAVAAAVAAFSLWALRRAVVSRGYLPDRVAGAVEDALVIALGRAIVLPVRR
ncbi:MAG TPA: hypothetical protein VNA88_00365 [Candidatus Kapabacteria bacterium]|nr:hypothetical protein [Candidatus Kapabacteria bacterium]